MASSLSTAVKRTGAASLHLVASRGGRDEATAVWQDLGPVVPGATYTLSYWYLPSTNGTDLTVRLAEDSLGVTHGIQPDKLATPGAPNSVGPAATPIPLLFLSEIEPVNTKGVVDHLGHHAPWVELVNLGTNTISLEGWFLSDGLTNLTGWGFPTGAAIQPGQYVVVWLDGQPNETTAIEWHANFMPPATNGSLFLAGTFDGTVIVVDALAYGVLAPDSSYGLATGVPGELRSILAEPTPGAANAAPLATLTVRINEWMASNTDTLLDAASGRYEDWFELYNGASRRF
jgi:hypothetical protein